jgi:hypothetical protein
MSSFGKLPVTTRTFLLSVQVGNLPKLSGSPEQFIKWRVCCRTLPVFTYIIPSFDGSVVYDIFSTQVA